MYKKFSSVFEDDLIEWKTMVSSRMDANYEPLRFNAWRW
jgi:hypothetical protein